MVIEIASGIYAVFVGFVIIIFWIVALIKKAIPEVKTNPIDITFHLFSEYLMAIVLISGGIGILTSQTWGMSAFFLSMGLVIYSTLNAAGHYGQLKKKPMFIMFIVLAVISCTFVLLLL